MLAPLLPSRLALVALLIAGTGCYLGRGVSVYGEGEELNALEGVWEGTYETERDGLTGLISFRLAAAADSAYGEVVMLSEPAGAPNGPPVVLVPRAERPRIRFVRVDHGVVAGTLDPYTSQTCACLVQTSFQGTISGDEIEGTFVSWRVNGEALRGGTWRAERVSGDRKSWGWRRERRADTAGHALPVGLFWLGAVVEREALLVGHRRTGGGALRKYERSSRGAPLLVGGRPKPARGGAIKTLVRAGTPPRSPPPRPRTRPHRYAPTPYARRTGSRGSSASGTLLWPQRGR